MYFFEPKLSLVNDYYILSLHVNLSQYTNVYFKSWTLNSIMINRNIWR